jgi:hypothetical protein
VQTRHLPEQTPTRPICATHYLNKPNDVLARKHSPPGVAGDDRLQQQPWRRLVGGVTERACIDRCQQLLVAPLLRVSSNRVSA